MCATAITAGAFFPPDLLAIRQNFSLIKQFFLAAAAQAHSVSAVRSHGFPPVVRLLLFLPALRLFPGHTPAHEPRSLLEGNCPIFDPVSARIDAALRSSSDGLGERVAKLEQQMAELQRELNR